MKRLLCGLLALAIFAGAASPVLAAASGTALGVNPDARAEAKKETRTLVVGSDIFIGDRVVTDANGLVQIKFSDATKLVVGPNSALLIEDYLLRNDGSVGKFAVDALSGSFRFITGGAPKDRYVIETPTGTIGVRGTAMDFYVTQIITYVLQLHGTSIECPDKPRPEQQDCDVLDAVCELGIMDNDQFEVIGHADEVNGAEDRAKLREWFLFINTQKDLLREFRVANAERCLRRSTGEPAGDSISEPGTSGPTPDPGGTPVVNPPGDSGPCGGNRIC
jgi:hypothetical protein